MFSKQPWYCCVCGLAVERAATDSYWNQAVCGKECWEEKKRREYLSIMGKEYRPTERKEEHA